MKRRTYRADTMKEARLKVKMDLGEEAQILETRRVEEGGFFGFMTDTVIEVDACRTPQNKTSSTSSRGTKSRSSSATSTKSRNGTRKNGRNGSEPRSRKSNGSVKSSGQRQFERSVDEPVEPNFSPREQATQLIEEKESSSRSEEHTYQRPKPESNDPPSDSAPRTSDTTENQTADSAEGPSMEKLTRVLENTDRLTEKIDALASSLDEEESSKNGSAESYPGKLGDVYQGLLDEGVEAEHGRDLIARARRQLDPDEIDDRLRIQETVKQEISSEIDIADPLRTDRSDTILLPFIGPTGVGKTTTMAKLAAYFSVEEGQSISFITFDTYRLAAVEQLRCYADILQEPIEAVMSEEEFQETLEEFKTESDIVFIDTAGRSQLDDERIGDLKSMIRLDESTITHLVVDATSRPGDLQSVLDGFDPIGYDRLVVTKLDETTQHGSILSLARRADAPLSYFTDGQDVPDDLLRLDPEDVASLIVDADGSDTFSQPVAAADLSEE